MYFDTVVCQAIMDQSRLDNMAANLELRFEVLSNLVGGCQIRLTFTNNGHYAIHPGEWAIYFSSLRKINHIPNPYNKMSVIHINGYLHKLKPANFPALLPGKNLKFYLSTQNAIVSKTDVMPNWYVAARGLEPRTILSTAGESLKFVGSFDTPSKWKRTAQDTYNPFTPGKRFKMNNIKDLNRAGNLITPTPLDVKIVSASQKVNLRHGTWKVVAQRGLANEGRYLAGMLFFAASIGQ